MVHPFASILVGLALRQSTGLTLDCTEWLWSSSGSPPQLNEQRRGKTGICRHQTPPETCDEFRVGRVISSECETAQGNSSTFAQLVPKVDCDVWWRSVTDDVIPPIPELVVPITEAYGACRLRDGRVGILGLAGLDFAQCVVGEDRLDGGGFDVLQARREERTDPSTQERDPLMVARLEEQLAGLSVADVELIEAATNSSFVELRQRMLSDELSGADLRAFFSSSRFVPHPLNAIGLHAVRAVLAERARDRRIAAYTPYEPEVLAEWNRDGILIRDYDAIGREEGLRTLLSVVSAEPHLDQSTFDWVARNVTAIERDPQFEPHIDSFATVVKVWLFVPPLDARHGPFTFVKGSHRLTVPKLSWMHAYSQAQAALREPSFRLRDSPEAVAAAPHFVEHCEVHAYPILTLPDTSHTLVIADTSAVHFRGKGQPGFVRKSFRLKGDNGGGLPRLDPFRWPSPT